MTDDQCHGRNHGMSTFELPNCAYVTVVSIRLKTMIFFFVFLWSRSITCCTRFVRENGLSPIFSGLWMEKCFELHTVSEVFYQHGFLLPTLERFRVNVRSPICLWTCLQPFGSHLPAHCWSSFSALPFQNYLNSHCHWYGGVHFGCLFLSVFSAACENARRESMEFRNILRFGEINLP